MPKRDWLTWLSGAREEKILTKRHLVNLRCPGCASPLALSHFAPLNGFECPNRHRYLVSLSEHLTAAEASETHDDNGEVLLWLHEQPSGLGPPADAPYPRGAILRRIREIMAGESFVELEYAAAYRFCPFCGDLLRTVEVHDSYVLQCRLHSHRYELRARLRRNYTNFSIEQDMPLHAVLWYCSRLLSHAAFKDGDTIEVLRAFVAAQSK